MHTVHPHKTHSMRKNTNGFRRKISIALYMLRQYPKVLGVRRKVARCGKNLQVFGKPVIVSPEDIQLDDNVILNSGCVLNATHSPLRIGNDVTISYGAMILSGTYNAVTFLLNHNRVHVDRETVIGDNVWICAGAIVCPGVHIGGV